MDLFPKYIVEDDFIILGKVSYHKNLITDKSKVKGGGWYRYNSKLNLFIFYDSSHEFGKAKLEDVKKCVEEGKVYSNPMQIHNLTDKHKFAYDTGSEIIELN